MNVRTYQGSGTLCYTERQIACGFTLSQSADGDVRLECATPASAAPPAEWIAGLFGQMPLPERFEGVLSDGRVLHVRGGFLAFPGGWSAAEGAKAFFELNGPGAEAVIGVEGGDARGAWRFGITNLLVDDRLWEADAGSRAMAWTIDGLSVRMRDLTTGASRRLFGSKDHTGVTADLELSGTLTFGEACDVASNVCSILSIAQGTLIAWIYAERESLLEGVTFARHHPAVTRPHNGALPLIDPDERNDLTRFVEAVYPKFRLKKDERGLAVLARALPDVRTTGFLETRALQVSSLIEFIVSRDAELHQRGLILDKRTFGKGEQGAKAAVRAALAGVYADASEAQLETMCSHVPGLNRVPFAILLAEASSGLGAEIPRHDIRQFLGTRNNLVHRGSFTSEKPWEEFRLMLSIVDRLILALLEYRGPYIDASTLRRVGEPDPHVAG